MKSLVLLSGGMDSTIAMKLQVEKYGADNVNSLSLLYGQIQRAEVDLARITTRELGVVHGVYSIPLLGELSKGVSANVDRSLPMPTISDVIGHPQPTTYVPNRNMILLSIAAAYAEALGIQRVICGFQIHDSYGYFDTTKHFVEAMNNVLKLNRKSPITIEAPFVEMSKTDELKLLLEKGIDLGFLKNTLTCYNPKLDQQGDIISCGRCPSCSERLQAFENISRVDPISYAPGVR